MQHTTLFSIYLKKRLFIPLAFIFSALNIITSCNNTRQPVKSEIVESPALMNDKVKEFINSSLKYAYSSNGKLDDSVILERSSLLDSLYKEKAYNSLWCNKENWLPIGDSLLKFIDESKLFGLFPNDYHFKSLVSIQNRFLNDSLAKSDRKDAALWARADLMLSDALIKIIKDVKSGRLPNDSITLRKDSMLASQFYLDKINTVIAGNSLSSVIASLEPKHRGYYNLKAGIKKFLDNAKFKKISIIKYPNNNHSELKSGIIRRLFESGYFDSSSLSPDSLQLAIILKKYQQDKYLTVDGKIGAQTIHELNSSDEEKFKRIAITLDRYKKLPEEMPFTYVWVNIPSFNLRLYVNDSVKILSRIVVGKPKTRTPVLSSSISEIITYPQWNIPQSIIVKEILPGLKRSSHYLEKKGYTLLNSKGEELNPDSINWSKYTKGIPYKVIQGSGDANALGVLKFNFNNKYAVYLHDTNQRFYFGLASRALSHGCVRVQEWEKLAFFILQNETESKGENGIRFNQADSVKHWLSVKEKHAVPIKNRLPLFIRYFTCDGKDGNIIFYEDIYDEDRQLADKYFAGKE